MAYFDTLFGDLIDVVRELGGRITDKLDSLIASADENGRAIDSLQQQLATTAQAAQGGGGGGAGTGGGGGGSRRGGGDPPGKGGIFNDLAARTKTQLKRGTAIGLSNAALESSLEGLKAIGAGFTNQFTAGSNAASGRGAAIQALQQSGFTIGGDTGGILDRAAAVTGGITEELARAGVKISAVGRQKILNQQILAEKRVQIEREQVANAANRARIDVNLAESARGESNLLGQPDTSNAKLIRALTNLTEALERNKPKSGF